MSERWASVGRIVHYVNGVADGKGAHPCLSAIITRVCPPGEPGGYALESVTLTVFNPDGIAVKGSVPRARLPEARSAWHWPAHCPDLDAALAATWTAGGSDGAP